MSEAIADIPEVIPDPESEATPESEFEPRIQKLMELTEDPEMQRRMLCEIYVFISEFDKELRSFKAFAEQNSAMGGVMARMFGMKKPGG